ncbi:MalY/PatB family protein [Vaginisenegalia massiliensis]|uniref:MalY/PatB family protein n=1 Tax=Vaginisenegalia massiliensis TaxID=2058294 RepID=UPI000F541CFE|nr:MalY/PatB family protein [Vaginisenegalia massiliensis]
MDFNQIIDRRGTYCTQWDYVADRFGQANLLPFTISDTDFLLPKEIIEILHHRVDHGVFGYSRWNHDDFKNCVKKWFDDQFDAKIESEWITYSPSVIYAVSQLIKIKSEVGQGVIIQTPAYDAFFKTIRQNDRLVVENPLIYTDGKYFIDFVDLEKLMSKKENRILLFCSPHNPSGRVWTKDELDKVISLCKKYDVFLISDEIHMDIVRKSFKHIPITEMIQENVALLTSGSKTFNFAGLLFSYLLIPDNETKELFLIQLKNADGLSSPSVLGMLATMTAYSKCGSWVQDLNEYIQSNELFVKKFLKENCPCIVPVNSEATYLMWLDISKMRVEMNQLQNWLVNKGKVAIMNGIVYGGNGEQFLRLNIGCSKGKIEQGLLRLKEVYNSLM